MFYDDFPDDDRPDFPAAAIFSLLTALQSVSNGITILANYMTDNYLAVQIRYTMMGMGMSLLLTVGLFARRRNWTIIIPLMYACFSSTWLMASLIATPMANPVLKAIGLTGEGILVLVCLFQVFMTIALVYLDQQQLTGFLKKYWYLPGLVHTTGACLYLIYFVMANPLSDLATMLIYTVPVFFGILFRFGLCLWLAFPYRKRHSHTAGPPEGSRNSP